MTGRIGTKGERMVELGQCEDGLRCRGFAGVGFDTACSQRRVLPAFREAGCVTAVGSDALSDGMPRSMEGKGVAISRVLRRDDRTVGLDAIAPRDGGRAFSRWRSRSAARLPAEGAEALAQGFDELDAPHVSAISVAVPEGRGRETLLAVVSAAAERGTRVSSDTDYRQCSGRARERRRCGRSTSPPPTPLRPRAMTTRRLSTRRSPRSSWSATSASAPRRPCRVCVSGPPGTSVGEFAPPPGSRGECPGHPRGAVPPRIGSPVAGDPSPIDPPAVDRGTGR